MPTFDLTEVQQAADAVSTAESTGSPTTEACELTTTRVEAEFAKVPTDSPIGCLTDVLKQDGMCALINGVRSSY